MTDKLYLSQSLSSFRNTMYLLQHFSIEIEQGEKCITQTSKKKKQFSGSNDTLGQ